MCFIGTSWKPRGVRSLGLALPFALTTALPGFQQAVPKHLPVFAVRDMRWDSGAENTARSYGSERTGGLGVRQESQQAFFASNKRLFPSRSTRSNVVYSASPYIDGRTTVQAKKQSPTPRDSLQPLLSHLRTRESRGDLELVDDPHTPCGAPRRCCSPSLARPLMPPSPALKSALLFATPMTIGIAEVVP